MNLFLKELEENDIDQKQLFETAQNQWLKGPFAKRRYSSNEVLTLVSLFFKMGYGKALLDERSSDQRKGNARNRHAD